MKYLIIGRAGSGKSSVAHELKNRGYNALDTDGVPGLARWEDAETGEPKRPTDIAYVDSSKFHWNWQKTIIENLLAENDELFLSGGADNDLTFMPSFDQTFVLNVNPDIQTRRLQSQQRNQENRYATHPDMIPVVLKEQKELVEAASKLGAVVINADRPLQKVVDKILNYTKKDSQ